MLGGLLARLRSWARVVGRRRELSAEMEAEFAFHIDLRAADLMREGLPAAEAARRARLEFGSRDRFREEGIESRGVRHLDEFAADVRSAVRSLARRPVFAAAAVLTLALGVGANAAVFSLVSATLLRPLPFPEPDGLVVLHQTRVDEGGAGPRMLRWSYAESDAVRRALSTLSETASYSTAAVNVVGATDAQRVQAELVSASYFGVLRVSPVMGRAFLNEEDVVPGRNPVAVLGWDLWQRHFGGDSAVLGRRILVSGVPLEVVGVMPAGFTGLSGVRDIWLPQMMGPQVSYEAHLTSTQRFHTLIGRLRQGVTPDEARAELATAGLAAASAARAASGDDGAAGWGAGALTLEEARRNPESVRSRLVLSGAVFLVLLIAAINLTALLLARSVERSQELALRTALGAGRSRLVRHLVVEGAVIGAAGAVVGAVLAVASVRTLVAVAAERLAAPRPWFADLAAFDAPVADWRVVAFAAGTALAAGVVAALVPALRATGNAIGPALSTGARGSTVGVGTLRRPTLLSAAAVSQIAGALVLLAGAALLLQAFERLDSIDPGFDADGLVTLNMASPVREPGDAAGAHAVAAPLLEQVLERVQAVPGVVSATLSFCTPYMWCSTTPLYIEGGATGDDAPIVGRHYVAADHFRTFGIPLLSGRTLTNDDRPGRPRVAVINETAARTFWPGENPIGRRVRFGSGGGFAAPDSLTEIVGVVGDVVYGHPGEPVMPDFYTSYLQFTWPRAIVTVRAATDPAALVPALRRAIVELDGGLPVYDVQTMRERGRAVLAAERFATTAVAAFAAIGLLLATVGVYGVMAYSVTQRRKEMGIRIALGATYISLLRFVVMQGLAVAAIGLVIGLLGAMAFTRVLVALVPNAQGADPLVLISVTVLLLLVCTAAILVPARAAARVDPVDTLAG